MADAPTRTAQLGKQGADFRAALVKGMARAYGARPSNAAPISHARELELYAMPTSPAAVQALKMGGTEQDAVEANRLWAVGMRQQQQQLRQQGQAAGTPSDQLDAQIHAAGLSDEAIFAACRSHAYELGKQAGHDDPAQEVQFHERMTAKLRAQRAQRQGSSDVTPVAAPTGGGMA